MIQEVVPETSGRIRGNLDAGLSGFDDAEDRNEPWRNFGEIRRPWPTTVDPRELKKLLDVGGPLRLELKEEFTGIIPEFGMPELV